jgi:hypothetical protein
VAEEGIKEETPRPKKVAVKDVEPGKEEEMPGNE